MASLKSLHLRVLALLAPVALVACSGGTSGNRANRGPFLVNLMSTGQGQIYPYRVRQLDGSGNPTQTILNIESEEILRAHVTTSNPVLPIAAFPTTALLPNGDPGNQFLLMRFSHELQVTSILSDQLANLTTNSGLTTAVSVLAYDPTTEATTVLKGRGFVNGRTFVNNGGVLEEIQAVENVDGNVQVNDPIAAGFPRGFVGDTDLVEANTFVFVADTDNNLSSIETFDELGTSHLIRILVTNSVLDTENHVLEQEICTATTVGADPNPGDVLGWTPNRTLAITPGNAAQGVDPQTEIIFSFNKPVQPAEVGAFFTTTNLNPPAGGIALNITLAASTFAVPYYADPISFGDFCNFRVRPLYSFPGQTRIDVTVNPQSITALRGGPLGNAANTSFTTGAGPGIVNAPVAPDAVYVGIGGANPGVAVIDLNGFGQGTSTADPLDSYFARRNPNIGQPGLFPPLYPGSSNLDAGSLGPLTMTEDTDGNRRLIGSPQISQVTDIHIGAPLDLAFNNANINVNAGGANQTNPVIGILQPGNCITVSTHPNPPKLVFPPPNPPRAIFAEEPTSSGGNNQLVPGNRPEYRPRAVTGFFGPAPPPGSPPPPPAYNPFASRQQIGHFLYVLDRDLRQILVVNSNRFTILDTIRLNDPIDLAMSPSLGLLAVANFSSSSVTFIDTDPRSAFFNTVVSESRIDDFPRKVAWQPDGESVLVLGGESLTLLNGSDFTTDKVVSGNLVDPIDLVVTNRYMTTGNTSNVYYAYILNANGTVAIYESGPDGANGIGFNDMIGLVGPVFPRAHVIKLDYTAGLGGFYVSHLDDANVATVSRTELTSSPAGPQPVQQQSGGFLLPPTFRQKEWTVTTSYGGVDPTQPLNLIFSGNSVADFALDDMFNNGAQPNQQTPYNGLMGLSIIGHSSKGAVLGGLAPIQPVYLFVALGDTGKIDVIDMVARVKVTTLDVPGVNLLSTYWRQ